MSWRVREYVNQDAESIFILWNHLAMNDEERRDSPEVIRQTLTRCEGKLYLAEEIKTKRIIGTAWITCDGRRMHLHHYGVHADFRNKGIGTQLLNTCVEYSKTSGYQLRLEVHKSNLIAKRIYHKFGFKLYHDYDIFVLRENEGYGIY